MHKPLPLFALIALHSLSLVRSAPELQDPGYTLVELMRCQELSYPTPEQALHCQQVIQELDREFHRCCLQRRSSHAFDNCRSCVPRSSEEAAVVFQDDTSRTSTGNACVKTHTNRCINRRRNKTSFN